ncbi:MAG TPA: 4-alpha-glucanotransferase [Chitinophagaceae bacterium]|nr:4-alpha-glucanotransferase [Chitinophagaceae bacterium]
MICHFHIKFNTHYGQNLVIRIAEGKGPFSEQATELSMEYLDDSYWYAAVDVSAIGITDHLQYQYVVREHGKPDAWDNCKNRHISIKKLETDEVYVVDDWQEYLFTQQVFHSKPFEDVFTGPKVKEPATKKPTHIFDVQTTHLPDDKVLCLCGAGKKLNDWYLEKPVLMKRTKNGWSVKLNLSKENFPLEYKFGVYDVHQKKAVFLEEGNNRVLRLFGKKSDTYILHHIAYFPQFSWKGAGVNVQLSSLKSERSWGVGDFDDLKTLTDWSVKTGIKMIQLLPINDTIASHNKKDSYPYSAVSAFALHPVFMNVEKLAQSAAVVFPDKMLEEVKALNELSTFDYESVAPLKMEAIAKVFEKQKHSFKDDFAYFDFFDLNRHWLVPYAAFSYLRDTYKTADYSQWGEYAVYDEEKIQELVSPDQPQYDEIAIHYFTQYHLHLQLKDAVEYAHKKQVIIKGDLPIGVGRFSVDTWMYPHLFHMDMQAGAPPDAFTTKGQNWSFPTYNWDLMSTDNYAWWRQRMEHMSNYFDAIRIDHVLGFFRIWSIPMDAIEGIFGRFVPSIPLYADDFARAGLHFDEYRFCEPYINDDLIYQFAGEDAQWVKQHILEGFRFRQGLHTQRGLQEFLQKHPNKQHVRQPLFDLLGNVILLRDDRQSGAYHFRISMQTTASFNHLSGYEQGVLNNLYHDYFFEKQNGLWHQGVQPKLNAIQQGSTMLICAEDLGMVPDMVEDVLNEREMLSLQVQRMPKVATDNFTHPGNAKYLTVVTPSTHDMSTVRQWWEEDRNNTQIFFNQILGHYGEAPYYCEPWVARDIVLQHLRSPAMWAVFLLQDLLAINAQMRRENPHEERINIPADPEHYWNYRMHCSLEDLLLHDELNQELRQMIVHAGR